jgi:hypothetical protein
LVALAFNKPYERAPHVVVTPRGEISAMIQAYLSGSRETDFGIGALVVPKPNETYQFEYFVTQNK